MADLFWPGEERAGALLTEAAFLAAMVAVEQSWLDALAAAAVASPAELTHLVGPDDVTAVATSAEGIGNPVLAVVTLLRERSNNQAVHRGLTSQDVVDTALILCLRDVVIQIRSELAGQMESLSELADRHRGDVMTGRTLGQHAVPITVGGKVATWLSALIDADEALAALTWPAQFGGAAGTLSAVRALVGDSERALELTRDAAERLDLRWRTPWHTTRRPITVIADALVTCTDAWGRIASDIVTLSRTEIGEVAEPGAPGRGGSSTMAHKRNPVLSVLLRRTAMTAPALASTLHLAAALANDERPDGSWHTEWATLRDLGRRTVVAASQASELLGGLEFNTATMSARAESAWADLHAEQESIAAFAQTETKTGAKTETGADPSYIGVSDALITDTLDRAAHRTTKELP